MKWFEEKFRHHLCDMHIEDWDEQFLSKFSPETYVENLKLAQVNAPMLYLQSHVGHCYWLTKSGHTHRHFAEHPEQMPRLISLCHENGMAVVGYYSLIYNTVEYDKHPEWRIIDKEGTNQREQGSRYGHCCPNNPGYRAFLSAQIREMSEAFRVEGMFYDMPFWPSLCCCEHCRARWEKEVGGSFPTEENFRDPAFVELTKKRAEWMGEFCRFVRAETERSMPWIESVEFNYASAMVTTSWGNGTCEEVGDACDFANGDLYGGIRLQSSACKVYDAITLQKPFEYMTSRCNPNLRHHTLTRSPDQLELQTLLTSAHHGATLIIDGIDPVGTMDRRAYLATGKAFETAKPYEPFFTGELYSEVGVLYMVHNKMDRSGRGFSGCAASVNAITALTQLKIPCSAVTRHQFDCLSDYPVILAPQIDFLTADEEQKLVEYVRGGGNLYFSGAEEPFLLKTLLGAECTGYTEHTSTYCAPTAEAEREFNGFNAAYPLPFDYSLPMLTGAAKENVLATITLPYTTPKEKRFASIHLDPPGLPTEYPAVIRAKVGKGCVLWSAAPLENEKIRDYRLVLKSLLTPMLPEPMITTDAPERVELITHLDGGRIRIGAVQISEDDILERVYPFSISVRTDRPMQVRSLPDGKPMQSAYADGMTTFAIDDLRIYRLVELY